MAYFDHNDELVLDQYDIYEYHENHGTLPFDPSEPYELSNAEIRDIYDTTGNLTIKELARMVGRSESTVKAILLEEL